MERLLPCPHCGQDVTDDEGCFPTKIDRSSWEVRCGNPYCFSHSPDAPTREAAIAKWNRRADHFANWTPTSENINALPGPVREFIMRLHANTDPAGELHRAMVWEMRAKAAERRIQEAPDGWVGTIKHGEVSQVVVHLFAPQQIEWADGKRVRVIEVDDE